MWGVFENHAKMRGMHLLCIFDISKCVKPFNYELRLGMSFHYICLKFKPHLKTLVFAKIYCVQFLAR